MKGEAFNRARVFGTESVGEITEKTVAINRVAKVVKGGRRFSFSSLVVAGNGDGCIGFGLGKAMEVPDAIKKATDRAKKDMVRIPLRDTTIPHEVIGHYGPTKVVMKPAAPGTGVIAGSAVRALVELSGIKDIRTKIIGSSNTHNVLHATLNGLLQLQNPENISSIRGSTLDEIGYQPY